MRCVQFVAIHCIEMELILLNCVLHVMLSMYTASKRWKDKVVLIHVHYAKDNYVTMLTHLIKSNLKIYIIQNN